MANKLHVFIPIGKFDRSKLSILDAKIKKSKKGNETCESLFAYDIGNGKRATDIDIQLPKKKRHLVFFHRILLVWKNNSKMQILLMVIKPLIHYPLKKL